METVFWSPDFRTHSRFTMPKPIAGVISTTGNAPLSAVAPRAVRSNIKQQGDSSKILIHGKSSPIIKSGVRSLHQRKSPHDDRLFDERTSDEHWLNRNITAEGLTDQQSLHSVSLDPQQHKSMVELIEKQKQQKPLPVSDKSFNANGAKMYPRAMSDVDGEIEDSSADFTAKGLPNENLILEQESVNNESDGGVSARTITAAYMANSADCKSTVGHQILTSDSHLMHLIELLQIESLSLEQLEKLHDFVAYHYQLKCVSSAKLSNTSSTVDPIAVKARKGMKRSKSSGSEYGFSPNRTLDPTKAFSDAKKGSTLRANAFLQSEDIEVGTITSKQPSTPQSTVGASPSSVSIRTNSRGNGACQPLDKMNGVNSNNVLLCLSPHNGPNSSVNSPLMDQSSRSSSRCSSRNHNLLRPTAANRPLAISSDNVAEEFCQSVDIPSSSLRHFVAGKYKHAESIYYSEPLQTDLSFIEAEDAIASAGSIDKLVQHNLYVARSLENGSSGGGSVSSYTSKQRNELVASPHSAFDDCCSIGSHSLNSNRSNLGCQSTNISSPSSTFQKRFPANQKISSSDSILPVKSSSKK